MSTESIIKYVDGLKRMMSFVLFLYVIVLLVSYAVVLTSYIIFAELLVLAMLAVLGFETLIFMAVIIVMGLPAYRLRIDLADMDGEEAE